MRLDITFVSLRIAAGGEGCEQQVDLVTLRSYSGNPNEKTN